MFEFYSDLQIESLNHIEKDFTSASMFIKWTDLAMSFWQNFFSKSWASQLGVRLICECS